MNSSAEVLPVVAAAGEMLLTCGAEVTRVEDTVVRIAQAYGVTEVGIFATPTGLMISLGMQHHLTVVRRIRRRTVALDRVSAINALSRELAVNPVPPAEALERIQSIGRQPGPLPPWTDVALSGLSAAAVTMLVGGTPRDFAPALLANILVQGVQRLAGWMQFPEAIGDFIAGSVAVLGAMMLNSWVGSEFPVVLAGGIILLLPGLSFTTSVRDAMAGDLLSAGARLLEATMHAAALAAGVSSTLFLTGRM